jgi:hypothetical protein
MAAWELNRERSMVCRGNGINRTNLKIVVNAFTAFLAVAIQLGKKGLSGAKLKVVSEQCLSSRTSSSATS